MKRNRFRWNFVDFTSLYLIGNVNLTHSRVYYSGKSDSTKTHSLDSTKESTQTTHTCMGRTQITEDI